MYYFKFTKNYDFVQEAVFFSFISIVYVLFLIIMHFIFRLYTVESYHTSNGLSVVSINIIETNILVKN